jgi:UDP-glucose 4-epimerase
MLRLAGKVSVPIPAPAFDVGLNAGQQIGMPRISPDFRRLLRFGRAVDITRLVDEVGYLPRFSATEAVEDYASHQGGRRVIPSIRHLAVNL